MGSNREKAEFILSHTFDVVYAGDIRPCIANAIEKALDELEARKDAGCGSSGPRPHRRQFDRLQSPSD